MKEDLFICIFAIMITLMASKSKLLTLRSIRNYIPTSQYSFKLKSNPFITLPIQKGQQSLGALQIQLFQKHLPRTVDNFLRLLKRYEGNKLYKIWPSMYLETGDITNQDGSGGESAKGMRVKDQSFEILHDTFGILSMVSNVNSINSKFIITFGPCHFFDYRYVAFGKVTKGLQVLRSIEGFGKEGGEPIEDIRLGKPIFHEAAPIMIKLADGTGNMVEREIYQPNRNY